MDCTSLSDKDGELFRYTYCFLRLKYGNILENCSEMERSLYQIIIKRGFESSGLLEAKPICS